MSAPAGASNPSAVDTPAPGASETPGAPARGAQDRSIPEKKQSSQSELKHGKQAPQRQGEIEHQPGARQGAAERHDGTTKQGAAERHEGSTKQGAAERPMTSKNVSLTTEQKTTIRKTVLTGAAPRVTGNVNFDIKVGVVVPRTIRVAPLPTTIVEIEPEWHGYMYFVRGDEIIVVEPSTLRIVAVLDV